MYACTCERMTYRDQRFTCYAPLCVWVLRILVKKALCPMNHLSSPQTAIKTIILLHYNLKIYCFDTYILIYLVCSTSACLCGCVHVCIYMLVWLCTCVHVHACVGMYMCSSKCLWVCIHMDIYMLVWVCTCVYLHVCVGMYTCAHWWEPKVDPQDGF